MGIDFYDRMWEEEQREKERFGQRKNEIENELSSQRRKIEELEKQIEKMKCCRNCKFQENGMNYELGEPCYRCEAFSNWELAE